MKNDNRFIVVHKEGSSFKEEGSRQILLDKEKGVPVTGQKTWK